MSRSRKHFRIHGLRQRFAVTIVFSLALSSLVFVLIASASEWVQDHLLENPQFQQAQFLRQCQSLQDFLEEHSISSENLSLLKQWETRHPVILLEIYSGSECLYSSFDVYENGVLDEIVSSQLENTVRIHLTDRDATAVLYSDYSYQYYVGTVVLSLVVSMVLFVLVFLFSNRKLIHYVCRLNEEVQILEGGNLEYEVSVEGDDEITELARSMNRMRLAFQRQMDSEQQLHEASRRLVTQMSHDLRTPLTGIILYLDILRARPCSDRETLEEYLKKIEDKAHQMRVISDNLFEYALESVQEGQSVPTDMEHALSGQLMSFQKELEAAGFSVTASLHWIPCSVRLRQEYLSRILENILSNIRKYAPPSCEVVITTLDSGACCGFSVLNGCASAEQAVESNGIGLESIRTMMEQMSGVCSVEQTDSAFEITLLFRKQ